MQVFHPSLHSQYNSRKPYLNKKRSIVQNGIFFKNVFNRKYVKFNINIMSKIVFVSCGRSYRDGDRVVGSALFWLSSGNCPTSYQQNPRRKFVRPLLTKAPGPGPLVQNYSIKTMPSQCGVASGQYRSIQTIGTYLKYLFSLWSQKHTHILKLFYNCFKYYECSTK